MSEKILVAMTGGSRGRGEPCGMMTGGFCIPLAATDAAREVIEAVGEDELAELLEANDVSPPKAGGVWVLECEVGEDPEGEHMGYRIRSMGWRAPTAAELEGLLKRQDMRSHGRRDDDPPDGLGRWVFLGALV